MALRVDWRAQPDWFRPLYACLRRPRRSTEDVLYDFHSIICRRRRCR